jgi:hypothetical protein
MKHYWKSTLKINNPPLIKDDLHMLDQTIESLLAVVFLISKLSTGLNSPL